MASLIHALEHHAQPLGPIAGKLALGYVDLLKPRGWELYPIRGGAASYVLKNRAGTKEYHFRPNHNLTAVLVKDKYYNGKVVLTLTSEQAAMNFIRKRIPES